MYEALLGVRSSDPGVAETRCVTAHYSVSLVKFGRSVVILDVQRAAMQVTGAETPCAMNKRHRMRLDAIVGSEE